MLLAAGFAVAAGRWWLGVLLVAMFLAIYVPTILSEESYLRATFAGFDEYAAKVPRLLPRLTAARFGGADGTDGRFDGQRYLNHREYNAVMGAAAIYAALALRMWVAAR
jgi:hypothetical protein